VVEALTRSAPVASPVPDRVLEELRRATLGTYDVAGLLGRGGMAIVYLAHELALDRKEAIKVLAPWLVDTEGAVQRFKREARTAAQLQHHKHIIPVYRIGQAGDLVWFSMMYVGGGALDDVMRVAGPLPIDLALVLLGQVGSALAVAHRAGIVHRDVKPANILLHEGGWVMMGDFGIAKVTQDRKLTMTGATVGTPTYMSPEQCLGGEGTTAASDQYSLGVVAYEMLAGRVPFEGDSAFALMQAHVSEAPRPLRELRPEVPPEVEAVVMRMLAKKPAERWPTMDDVLVALTGSTYPTLGTDAERRQLLAWARAAGAPFSGRFPTPMSPHPASRSQPALPGDHPA
jgi:serine/threonine-protein kinase